MIFGARALRNPEVDARAVQGGNRAPTNIVRTMIGALLGQAKKEFSHLSSYLRRKRRGGQERERATQKAPRERKKKNVREKT